MCVCVCVCVCVGRWVCVWVGGWVCVHPVRVFVCVRAHVHVCEYGNICRIISLYNCYVTIIARISIRGKKDIPSLNEKYTDLLKNNTVQFND